MLCDICQKREATSHETHCTNIKGEVPKERHLCNECFEASYPTQAHEMATAFKVGCKYCGGKPEIGGDDPFSTLTGDHKMRFLCKSCAGEYFGFVRRRLPGFGTGNITKDQIATIQKTDIPALFTELEEHMRKWVSKRDSH